MRLKVHAAFKKGIDVLRWPQANDKTCKNFSNIRTPGSRPETHIPGRRLYSKSNFITNLLNGNRRDKPAIFSVAGQPR